MKIGNYVKFGHYFQNNSDIKEPIKWLVLDVSGNEALLISRYGLDCNEYHYISDEAISRYENIGITWENCDLRKWLNNDFLKAAFSEEECERIMISELTNDGNPKYRTRGGNSTSDRVFCLSLAEVEQFFENDGERQCKPTDFAKHQGAYVDDSNGCCVWWLRSPGCSQHHASSVEKDGTLYRDGYGYGVYLDFLAVRPALRMKL